MKTRSQSQQLWWFFSRGLAMIFFWLGLIFLAMLLIDPDMLTRMLEQMLNL